MTTSFETQPPPFCHFAAMGAACARRRPQLLAEGETPFWEEIEKSKASVSTAATSADERTDGDSKREHEEAAEKDEAELPGGVPLMPFFSPHATIVFFASTAY